MYIKRSIGEKIGNLTILDINEKSCTCKCDCGTICIKSKASLRDGKHRGSLSCGCAMYQYLEGNKNYKFKGFGEISAHQWIAYLQNAKRRNLEFEIDIYQAWNKFLEQNRKCNISGTDLIFSKHNTTASLDRIDPSLPYCLDNIQWVHKIINDMKWNIPTNYFIYYCYISLNPIKNGQGELLLKKWHKNFSGTGNISKDYWYRIKNNAKTQNLSLNINIDDGWKLFISQNGCCSITGLPLNFTKKSNASLVRINKSIGYEPNNIFWVHKDISLMIKNVSLSDYYEWCEKIVKCNMKEE